MPYSISLSWNASAGVLTAAVRVMHQARRRFPAEPRHGQRVDHDVGCHSRLDRPADDFAIEQIEHDGQVQPAFVGPDVREIGRPRLVGRRRARSFAPASSAPPAARASSRWSPCTAVCAAPECRSHASDVRTRSLLAGKPRPRISFTIRGEPYAPLSSRVNGADQRQQLRVPASACRSIRAAALPRPITTAAHAPASCTSPADGYALR